MKKIFSAEDHNLDNVLDFVREKLEENEANIKLIMTIPLAIEEIFVNVAHYAYKGAKGDFEIDLAFKDDTVVITIEDSGVEFNPLAKEDPDIHLSAEDRKIGGLGIFMVKKIMDSVEYKRENDKNILTLTKKIK